MSRPKSAEEHMLELLQAVDWECYDAAVAHPIIATRDVQIRQQERVRVRELCDAAKATGIALEMARVREVLCQRKRQHAQAREVFQVDSHANTGAQSRWSECVLIARDLGIDLERPDPAEHAKAERKCVRCGERYFDGETRCEDECAAGAGSIGCCGGDVVPVDAATEGTDG